MRIEKSKLFAGLYEAWGEVGGYFFTGSGVTRSEALDRLFEKAQWVHDYGINAFYQQMGDNDVSSEDTANGIETGLDMEDLNYNEGQDI